MLSYFLLILGAFYFLIGIYYEKINFKHHRVPYFLGAYIIFFSLWRLEAGGTLLRDLTGSTEYNRSIIGWSKVSVGVIYLLLAWGIEKLRNLKIVQGLKYKELFNFVGPLWVLWAIFNLGLGGSKPLYETLLLLSSLGFIFGSIPMASRKFLHLGTLFLIIYIFSIGSEYFNLL